MTLNNPLTEPQIPQAIARDSEVAAAIANHVPGDPHPQYLPERLLPLLQHVVQQTAFNANEWNPNQGQNHASAINVIYAANLRIDPTTGGFISAPNLNLPSGQLFGMLIQIEPFANQGLTTRTQFFIGTGIFWREFSNNNWNSWINILTTSQLNTFIDPQNFSEGIRVGSGALIKKILSQEFTIDPPAVASQGATPINLTITGATVGDVVYIAPIGTDIINTGIWPFEWPAVVSSANNVALLLRNDWSGTLDLAPLKIRVVVMGF